MCKFLLENSAMLVIKIISRSRSKKVDKKVHFSVESHRVFCAIIAL